MSTKTVVNDGANSAAEYYYKNKPYKPLRGSRLVLCVSGAVLGFINLILTVHLLVCAACINPGFLAKLGLYIFMLMGLITGVFAVVLLSICLPLLIFRTRKSPPKKSNYLLIRIILPCALSLLYIAGFVFPLIRFNNYPFPTFEYKGAVFEYYEDYNEDGSNGLFREGTVIIGLDPDSPVPERLEIPGKINGRSVSGIYADAFKGNTTVTEVVLPDVDYFYIRHNAFEGCSSLKKVIFKHYTSIDDYAFKDCTSLTQLVKDWVKNDDDYVYFDDNSFEGCPDAENLKQQLNEEEK